MKKLIFLIILGTFIPDLFAQNTTVDKLFEKYSGKEGYTTVFISKYMFELFTDLDTGDPESKEALDVMSKLDNIKIIVAEGKQNSQNNFYNEVIKELPVKDYKELMVIQESNQIIKFYIKESNKKISELLMLSGGNDDNVLISILGDIDLKSIAKISRALNIEGMDQLNNIK